MIKKITSVYNGFVCNSRTLSIVFTTFLSIHFFSQNNTTPTTYFEDFNSAGYPSNLPSGAYWTFHNEIDPSQDDWNKFIPGDGNAYLTVDADTSNDLDWIHPFQTLEFGGVGQNHRLEVRMKGAVVDGGLVGFLFTYNQEGSIFNEVDIEVVANDAATPNHETLPENGGWTDARFNSWRNANENSNRPFTGTKKPVVNNLNEKISLIDDDFHTYTIDWREDRIDFFIDGVLQEVITTNVATGWSEVIIGFRQLPWAGGFNWSGKKTMVIDYLKIEPLENVTFATNDFFTVVEDTPTELDVLANDSSNTSIISFDNETNEGFPITLNEDMLTYSPSNGFVGQDSFTYTIEDIDGTQKTATVFLTVEKYIPPLNAENDSITVAPESVNNTINVTSNDEYGPNGKNATHPLTLPGGKISTATNLGGAINVVDGKVNYSPPAGFLGVDTFEYTITDGNGYADSATVTITVGGAIQATARDDAFTVLENTVSTLDVLANDTANTTILSFDAVTEQGMTVINNSNILSYNASGNFIGQDNFSYTIVDGYGNESTANVIVNVEEILIGSGPLMAVNDAITVEPNSSETIIDVTENDSYGSNGKNATHPLTLPGGKTITATNIGGSIRVVNGKVNYAPLNGFTGIDSFEYTITDANGFAAKAKVTVTVGEPVDAEANNDTFDVSLDTPTNLNVLENDSPGTTIISFDENSLEGFVITGNNTVLNYAPINGFLGEDSFSYTIQDANGNQSSATVTITVKEIAVSSGPITAVNDNLSVNLNSTATLIDVTANDSYGSNGKNNSHPLTLNNGKLSTASNNGGPISIVNNKISYTPPTSFRGVDSFEYTITDGNGFADKAIVTIIVGEAEDAEARDDAFTVNVDTATSLHVLENDTFGTEIISFDTTSSEGFTISKTGTLLLYTPTDGFLGQDSFGYTIQDANGNVSSAEVTITVEEVEEASGPITAVNDAITIDQNSTEIAIDVTSNDNFGANGENATHPLTLTNGKLVTASLNGGPIRVTNGKINYTAPNNFTGIDRFEYTITDAKGFADKATVTITITDTNVSRSSNFNTDDFLQQSKTLENSFTSYPNPSRGYLKNTLYSSVNTKAQLILVSVTGKVIYTDSIEIRKGLNVYELNINMQRGIAFVKIISKTTNFGTSKVIFK